MLIVVLVSICLISFSAIAYSTAKHGLKQSDDMIERTKTYYDACNEAETFLSSLTGIPDGETTYSFPLGRTMDELQVTIAPDNEGNGYTVKSWVISDTASWEAPSLPEGDSGGGPEAPVK